jgi:hypothetical protein
MCQMDGLEKIKLLEMKHFRGILLPGWMDLRKHRLRRSFGHGLRVEEDGPAEIPRAECALGMTGLTLAEQRCAVAGNLRRDVHCGLPRCATVAAPDPGPERKAVGPDVSVSTTMKIGLWCGRADPSPPFPAFLRRQAKNAGTGLGMTRCVCARPARRRFPGEFFGPANC